SRAAAVPANRGGWENLDRLQRGRGWYDSLGRLGRHRSFWRASRVVLLCWRMELFLAAFCSTWSRNGADDLQLPRLLQRLQPRRRDEGSTAKHSARNLHFEHWHHCAISSDADEHPQRDPLARGGTLQLYCECVH